MHISYRRACIDTVLWLLAGYMGIQRPAGAGSGPVVTIASGSLQGARGSGVDFFKGIPYAASPSGRLRWRPPQPVAHWHGVREATQYGHDCEQEPGQPLQTAVSEDCLYLNVWRPPAARHLPVMVWIYGGGFVSGGSSPGIFDGTKLAAKGVVFVSFNYRVGRFGFFAFPALTAEDPTGPLGNYGYMDQIAALQWVRANIAAFGGDPQNVTVFGESAGGVSVNTLLTSPRAEGLFQKAAIESGGGRTNSMRQRRLSRDLPGLPSAESVGLNFARAHGIKGSDAVALSALRALPADAIVAMDPSPAATYSGPILDGRIVVEPLDEAYEKGHFAHVPVLVGANSADLGISSAQTMAQALEPFGADESSAIAAYDPEHSQNPRVVATRIAADRMMVEPARFVAGEVAGHGLPAYEYRFSYVAPAEAAAQRRSRSQSSFVPGAKHTAEIAYVFDTIGWILGSDLTEADEAMAGALSSYWTNFARTGNPNGDSLPKWPAYSTRTDTLMNFALSGPRVMRDPWHSRLDLIVKHFVREQTRP